jgi:predicted nucleic acid-binding protein
MTGPVFVDTNLLVYARDASEPAKQQMAQEWMKALWATRSGRLSYQVLQEYYTTVTRKLNPGMPREQARADIAALLEWRPVEIDAAVIAKAWEIEDRYQLSWWDALIAAAATASRCSVLLTEDLSHEMLIGGVRVVNPFRGSLKSFAAPGRR